MTCWVPAPNAAGGMIAREHQGDASIAKTGDHELLVSTEGSARQHGRGIAQAIPMSELINGGKKAEGHEKEGGHEDRR